jgi:hypothetical protein
MQQEIEMILCQAVPSLPRQVQSHITVAGIIAKNVANVNKPLVFFLVYAGSGSGQSVLLIWADPEHRES